MQFTLSRALREVTQEMKHETTFRRQFSFKSRPWDCRLESMMMWTLCPPLCAVWLAVVVRESCRHLFRGDFVGWLQSLSLSATFRCSSDHCCWALWGWMFSIMFWQRLTESEKAHTITLHRDGAPSPSVDSTLIWDQELLCCCSRIHSQAVWSRSLREDVRPAQTEFHPRHPSRGILFVFLCERVQVPLVDDIRELGGGQPKTQLTFNFIRMNSWLSEERAAELWVECCRLSQGHGSCLEGPGSEGSPHHSRGFVVQ